MKLDVGYIITVFQNRIMIDYTIVGGFHMSDENVNGKIQSLQIKLRGVSQYAHDRLYGLIAEPGDKVKTPDGLSFKTLDDYNRYMELSPCHLNGSYIRGHVIVEE